MRSCSAASQSALLTCLIIKKSLWCYLQPCGYYLLQGGCVLVCLSVRLWINFNEIAPQSREECITLWWLSRSSCGSRTFFKDSVNTDINLRWKSQYVGGNELLGRGQCSQSVFVVTSLIIWFQFRTVENLFLHSLNLTINIPFPFMQEKRQKLFQDFYKEGAVCSSTDLYITIKLYRYVQVRSSATIFVLWSPLPSTWAIMRWTLTS